MKTKDIPADEMLLAEAIAAAKARGLTLARHAYFRDLDGHVIDIDTPNAKARTASCCVIGALSIAGKIRIAKFGPLHPLRAAPRGSDGDCPIWGIGNQDSGESMGHAFRQAMTESP